MKLVDGLFKISHRELENGFEICNEFGDLEPFLKVTA